MTPEERYAGKVILALLVLELVLVGCAFYYAHAGTDLPITPPAFGQPTKGAEPEPEPVPDNDGQDPRDTPPPTFWGEEIETGHDGIVYVLDASTSMSWGAGSGAVQRVANGTQLGAYQRPDGTWYPAMLKQPNGWPMTMGVASPWNLAQAQTCESILALAPNIRFNVYTYDCATQRWAGQLQEATTGNKAAACSWVMAQAPGGGTGTGPAVASALTSHRDAHAVVLLTDGSPGCLLSETGEEHRRIIRTANQQQASVSVFGFRTNAETRAWCQAVAAENQGSYTDVR